MRTRVAERYEGAFQSSPLLYDSKTRKDNQRLELCLQVFQFVNQSAVLDNLVREACQRPHYPVNNFVQSSMDKLLSASKRSEAEAWLS